MKDDAPNLRKLDTCMNCRNIEWRGMSTKCLKHDFYTKDNYICDDYENRYETSPDVPQQTGEHNE